MKNQVEFFAKAEDGEFAGKSVTHAPFITVLASAFSCLSQ